MNSIGVDLGATTIKAAVVTPDGTVEKSDTRPTSPESPDQIVQQVVDLVQSLRGENRDWPVGVAVAAFLDPGRRIVTLSPNIRWEQRPLADELEKRLGCAVVLENDANAAGWAEYQVGGSAGRECSVMFTLGTGVGGAVIEGGQLLVGAHGIAGELGHLTVEYPGAPCGCGQRGCVETVASATGMVRQVREAQGHDGIGIAELETLLSANPSLASTLFQRAATGMARAIIQVHAVVDPEVIVLGGGIIERTGDVLLGLIRESVQREAAERRSPIAPIVPAKCGNQAGMIGAALLAGSRPHSAR